MDNTNTSPEPKDSEPSIYSPEACLGTGSKGTWSFWLMGILIFVMVAWAGWKVVASSPTTPAERADESYKPKLYTSFDMETCLIPEDEIRGGGPKKDGIPALVDPPFVLGSEVQQINREMHGKYLVSGDRVLGVEINGESRAYPFSILTWHEIVNDTVGGMPIAVTYCPLCDSAVVFSRVVGEETLEFGVSGLLYNSNVLLFDRRTPEPDGSLPVVESLWSQLLMKAVCGPAAKEGRTLDVLHSELSHWGDWFNRHPKTTVLSLDTGHPRDYKENPYDQYFHTGKIMFDLNPRPDIELDAMARGIAVKLNGQWGFYVYNQPDDIAVAQESAKWEQDGLLFSYEPYSDGMQPPTVAVSTPDGKPLAVVYSFLEPWYAMHPESAAPVILEIPLAD